MEATMAGSMPFSRAVFAVMGPMQAAIPVLNIWLIFSRPMLWMKFVTVEELVNVTMSISFDIS